MASPEVNLGDEILEPKRLSRREFIERVAVGAFQLGLAYKLAEAGAFRLAGSPISRFFLIPENISQILPGFVQLSTEEMKNGVMYAPGASYVSGEGSVSPIDLMVNTMREAGLGNWQSDVRAVSGSLLSDVPSQLKQLQVDTGSHPPTRLVTTDSGYNTAVLKLLQDSGVLDDLQYILSHAPHLKIHEIPHLIKRLDTVCGAFFEALDSTEEDLVETVTQIFSFLTISQGFVYTWPPLELAKALEHIPKKGVPEDSYFRFKIRGDAMAELFAKRASILGSNMTYNALERIHDDSPSLKVVPINLRRTLVRANYTRSDEHPGLTGFRGIARRQLAQTHEGETSLLDRVGKGNLS